MKGDFSKWKLFDPNRNDSGVLQQQGRVLLDQDWNAQAQIVQHWQDHFARETLGNGVASVPATTPEAFKVLEASLQDIEGNSAVKLTLGAGTVWADGIPVHLGAETSYTASYLTPPLQDPQASEEDLTDGTRDAVILEVFRESIGAFQEPKEYFEPALGGVDTTERIRTAYRLKLLRLENDDCCSGIPLKLNPNEDRIGRLSVSLEPATSVGGDCPVVGGGGYTGFEHHLYRIEIAETDGAEPQFKWSPFNGGLVGRGRFDDSGSTNTVVLTANRNTIVNAGTLDFYLEALALNPDSGNWEVIYGTRVSRNPNDELEVQGSPLLGSFPADSKPSFFRLWHGIDAISPFTNAASPKELIDGIQLTFEDPSTKHYEPGDYWTFPVRAGEIRNEETLIDQALPQGVVTHQVPLAIIEWGAQLDTAEDGDIIDCRQRFRPLTADGCCTYQVGDGFQSFGDFNSIEEALHHLPERGGHLCLLPGRHRANALIQGRKNITIHGCGTHTRILPREEQLDQPIFTIEDSANISLQEMDLIQLDGTAVVVGATKWELTREFSASKLRILAGVSTIQLHRVIDAEISDCRLAVVDSDFGKAVIDAYAESSIIKDNLCFVIPAGNKPPTEDDEGPQPENTPSDPCADSADFYGNSGFLWIYAEYIWNFVTMVVDFVNEQPPYKAIGGVHLRGGCQTMRVYDNIIRGGRGHGITFGGILISNAEKEQGRTLSEPADAAGNASYETTAYSFIKATVLDSKDQAIEGAAFTFKSKEQGSFTGISDAEGNLELALPAGDYAVTTNSDRKIVKIEEDPVGSVMVGRGQIRLLQILTEAEDRIPAERLEERAPLQNIRIERNAILAMGLSGIGFAWHSLPNQELSETAAGGKLKTYLQKFIDPAQLTLTTSTIEDLRVGENYIHGCFLTPVAGPLKEALEDFGIGGITLPVCDLIDISSNRISQNGMIVNKPATGIYVGFCNDLLISHNTIEDQGKVGPEGAIGQQDGIRGGIYVRYAGIRPAKLMESGYNNRRPAVRINHNRVDQPVGRALTIFAFGPIECSDNYFHSGRHGKRVEDQLLGTVLILNLAGVHLLNYYQNMANLAANPKAFFSGDLPQTGAAPNSDSAPRKSHSGEKIKFLRELATKLEIFPLGQTKLQGNIVEKGGANQASISQFVLSLDDIAFQDNHSACLDLEPSVANTVLIGQTLRAQGNRFTELSPALPYSLFSLALSFNQSTYNQADHCIVSVSSKALPGYQLNEGNQIRINAWCDFLKEGTDGSTPTTLFFYFLILSYIQSKTNLDAISQDQASNEETQQSIIDGASEAGTQAIQHNYAMQYNDNVNKLQYQTYRYGSDHHPEVLRTEQILENEATINAGIAENLDYSILTERQKLEAEGHNIEGKVILARGKGSPGLTVQVLDEAGEPTGLETTTGPNGSYRIPVEENTWKELADSGKMKLAVKDPGDEKIIHVADDTVTFSKDDRAAIKDLKVRSIKRGSNSPDIVLNAKPSLRFNWKNVTPATDKPLASVKPGITRKTRKPGETTRKAQQPSKPNRKTATPSDAANKPNKPTRRELTREQSISELSQIHGVGRARAEKMIDAGIRSFEDVLEAPNEKLEEVIPRVSPSGIKAEVKKYMRKRP